MIMERPSHRRLPALALRLAHVVQQSRPPEPEVVALPAYILQHLQRVVVVVLVCLAIACLYKVKLHQLRQNEVEQARLAQIVEAPAGVCGKHNLVELGLYALAADNVKPVRVAPKSLEGLRLNGEVELCGEPHAAQHAEGVVGECDVGVQRCGYYSVLKVVDSIERVYQLAKPACIEAYCHGVDGEVTAVLVIGKCPLLHNGLARVVAVALPSGTDKLHLHVPVFHLCRSEIAEHREVGRLAENVLQRCSHTNAASYNHHVDIF